MNKKILIIIKSHDKKYADYHNEVYEQIEEISRDYLLKKTEVDFVYVKANPNLNIDYLFEEENNNFWIKAHENYWECLKIKVLKSIKYFTELSYKKYDYIFITNLSTFINVDKLIDECNNLDKNLCAAVTGSYQFANLLYPFPSGAGAIYSNDLLKRVLKYQETINHELYPNTDDIFFGKVLYELNTAIKPINRLNICSEADYQNILNDISVSSHIRIKIDNNRNAEPKYHK